MQIYVSVLLLLAIGLGGLLVYLFKKFPRIMSQITLNFIILGSIFTILLVIEIDTRLIGPLFGITTFTVTIITGKLFKRKGYR